MINPALQARFNRWKRDREGSVWHGLPDYLLMRCPYCPHDHLVADIDLWRCAERNRMDWWGIIVRWEKHLEKREKKYGEKPKKDFTFPRTCDCID